MEHFMLAPPEIERQIDDVLPLGIPDLRERLAVRDDKAPAYLQSEALVHLVRMGIVNGRQKVLSAVLPVLLGRCARNLHAKIHEGDFSDVESFREEILSQFSELFVGDRYTADKLVGG
jgi:hypothetical protein